jgi:arsenate reductase (thioredoxin)
MADKNRVLILGTGNSARSQMAEGLLRHDAGERFTVESAGTKPSNVRPEAIAVMKELGIDITSHRSKHVDEFAGQDFNYVLTVCDNAKESCPVFFGKAKRLHRSFAAPISRAARPPLHPFRFDSQAGACRFLRRWAVSSASLTFSNNCPNDGPSLPGV